MATMTNEELADAIKASFECVSTTAPETLIPGSYASRSVENPLYSVLVNHHKVLLAAQAARAQHVPHDFNLLSPQAAAQGAKIGA